MTMRTTMKYLTTTFAFFFCSLMMLTTNDLLFSSSSSSSSSVLATQELNGDTFKELTTSGKNGMIKFFQPWCGHCTKMKPAWDQLADEAHPSVFIADVNCSDEEDLCSEHDVQGYPTIKVYQDGGVDDYKGGRTFDNLMEFVNEELAQKCDIQQKETCSDKANTYASKWLTKDNDAIELELTRLTGMISKSMTKDLKTWLKERIAILRQLEKPSSDEDEDEEKDEL